MKVGVNRSTDGRISLSILSRILDSERNFNGSADPMITADCGFTQFFRSAQRGKCQNGLIVARNYYMKLASNERKIVNI